MRGVADASGGRPRAEERSEGLVFVVRFAAVPGLCIHALATLELATWSARFLIAESEAASTSSSLRERSLGRGPPSAMSSYACLGRARATWPERKRHSWSRHWTFCGRHRWGPGAALAMSLRSKSNVQAGGADNWPEARNMLHTNGGAPCNPSAPQSYNVALSATLAAGSRDELSIASGPTLTPK